MALNDTDEDLLIRYLDGELNGAEGAALDARLAREPELRAELERLQLATRALHWGALNEAVATARAQHEGQQEKAPENPQQGPAPVRSLRWLRRGLAAAAVLVGLWIGIRWWDSTHLSPEQVYTRHALTYELSETRAGEAVPALEAAFAQKRYETVYNMGNGNAAALSQRQLLLTGLSALYLKRSEDAVTLLQRITSGPYKEDAEFYRALALVRAGHPKEALPLLRAIHEQPTHLYHSRVTAAMIEQVEDLE